MKCSSCGFDNELGAVYCERCGSPLAQRCPQCGNTIKPGAIYCIKCGARLSYQTTQAAKPQQSALSQEPSAESILEKPQEISPKQTGERKPVAILFTDIVGSTSIAEQLDPEEWKEIVAGAHQLVSQAVYRYDGMIAQLLGDGVLAFFGAPLTHEDDPLRAVHAALDIQASLPDYRRQLAGLVDDFQLRVGIHAGTVVVGQVGDDQHAEYLAVGDTVNLAARLQSAARPGGILISDSIARQVKAVFDLQPLGEITVKGKAEPVSVHEVIREKAVAENPRGFEELHSPLVGRDHELGLLQDAISGLVYGRGQVVMILGEAGIGKSRLVEEACRMAEASQERIHWIEGRALSYGQSLSFWLIKQLLYSDLGLSDGDPEIRIRSALKKRGNDLFGAQASEVLPYLFHLTGVTLEGNQVERTKALDGETLKHQTIVSITRYFEQLAQIEPTVVVFEDLHWADPSSLKALEQILALTDRLPLALILVARHDRELPSWQVKLKAETDYAHRYTEIELKPLSGDDQNRLVENLVSFAELPPSIRQLIFERAEGNPFYLEEIIRSLIDQGVLCYVADCWRTTGDIHNIHIPATLEGVLLARIDRLQEDIRHTLQLASVIGRSFLYRLLVMITETEQEVDYHLTQLQRADLVLEKSRRPELEYIFKHSLTQEAAYNSLLLENRREFHRRVGEALEELFAGRKEQYLGLLAYHFEAAGEQSKAIDYLIRVGDQARLTDEHTEAIDYYHRAIKLLDVIHDEERASQVWLKLGLIYHANFEFEASHQAYEAAFKLEQKLRVNELQVKKEELATFREIVDDSFVTFDPGLINWQHDAHVARMLFSGLARLSSDMDVLPEVARSWQVLDGGRRYLFHLRDDFKWSDGTPVTAADFEWAWKRNLDPLTGSHNALQLFDVIGARTYHQGIDPNPEHVGVRALDTQTLEVLLVQPVAYFPFILTLPVTFPLPRMAIEQYGEDWWQLGKIITNGPFNLFRADMQKSCLVGRNPDYPDQGPGNISRIEWLVMREVEEKVKAYLENRTDFMSILAFRIPDSFPQQEISFTPLLQIMYMYFDPSFFPLNDVRVRKALIMAFDGEKFRQRLNATIPRGGLIPPGMPGHSPDIGLPSNIEMGRQYLAEAGFPGGKGFPTLPAVTLYGLVDKIAAEVTRQWHENLGIEVVFQGSDPWEILDRKEKGISGAITINGWVADYPDPDNFLRQSEAIAMLSYYGWRDVEYDQLVERAASTSDRGKRMAMYRQADYRLVHEQALVMPLSYGQKPLRNLIKPWVKKFDGDLLGGVNYQNIIIEEH